MRKAAALAAVVFTVCVSPTFADGSTVVRDVAQAHVDWQLEESLDLRARAEAKLGARFDVRRFHETALGSGALPLALLARHIDDWIAEETKR